MKNKMLLIAITLSIAVTVISACRAGNPLIPATSTAFIAPDPLTDSWLGEWTVWVQEEIEEAPEMLVINAKGPTLEGEVYLNDDDRASFSAELNSDGSAAVGNWQSESGKSGAVSMLISSDGSRFLGNLQGVGPMCAVREGDTMPDPCESDFALDWSGGWYIWIGPQETEGRFYYDPAGESAGPLSYEIKAFISGEDSSVLLGTWEAVGSKGEIELTLSENGIQFSGNIDGQFPFCGVRPGGDKPEPCFAP